ncbi:hypothetical protein BaRGS_00010579 [Batillaria attramentaria]|uniref:Uncharacterized protein n=1 Tax=Batillaria attramentaria TaxID=370345 RepID=A0ABD0LFS7_9CAEN
MCSAIRGAGPGASTGRVQQIEFVNELTATGCPNTEEAFVVWSVQALGCLVGLDQHLYTTVTSDRLLGTQCQDCTAYALVTKEPTEYLHSGIHVVDDSSAVNVSFNYTATQQHKPQHKEKNKTGTNQTREQTTTLLRLFKNLSCNMGYAILMAPSAGRYHGWKSCMGLPPSSASLSGTLPAGTGRLAATTCQQVD